MSTTGVTTQAPLARIEEIGKHEGQTVELRGWLYNLRESGKLLFPQFRDGSGVIQGVVPKNQAPEAFEALKGLTQESSVIVTGKIRADNMCAFLRDAMGGCLPNSAACTDHEDHIARQLLLGRLAL